MNKLANIGTDLLGPSVLNPSGSNDITPIGKLVYAFSSNAIVIAGVILIIMIIYSGISMVGASGDPQQFAKAQGILTSGIIGFVIVLAAWFIIKIVETSTGVSIL